MKRGEKAEVRIRDGNWYVNGEYVGIPQSPKFGPRLFAALRKTKKGSAR